VVGQYLNPTRDGDTEKFQSPTAKSRAAPIGLDQRSKIDAKYGTEEAFAGQCRRQDIMVKSILLSDHKNHQCPPKRGGETPFFCRVKGRNGGTSSRGARPSF